MSNHVDGKNGNGEEGKQYNIETVQDMADATNPDNLDAFLKDLRSGLLTYHYWKGISEKTRFNKMIWIDDGKHDQEVNLNFEDPDFEVADSTEEEEPKLGGLRGVGKSFVGMYYHLHHIDPALAEAYRSAVFGNEADTPKKKKDVYENMSDRFQTIIRELNQ